MSGLKVWAISNHLKGQVVCDEHGTPVGKPLTGHSGSVMAVAVGRLNGRDVIVSGSNDQTVRMWDGAGSS